MDILELQGLLNTFEDIKNVKKTPNTGHFEREFTFEVRGVEYKIIWWENIMYLHIGEVFIPFRNMDINGSWPNQFQLNINFYVRKGTGCFTDNPKTVAVIPLREHK